MRSRKEIEQDAEMGDRSNHFVQKAILEVLLDIRDIEVREAIADSDRAYMADPDNHK